MKDEMEYKEKMMCEMCDQMIDMANKMKAMAIGEEEMEDEYGDDMVEGKMAMMMPKKKMKYED